MDIRLFVIALVFAVVDWISVSKNWKTVEYFTKPTVMVALLLWLFQIRGVNNGLIWFELGLLFSLAGDVFLMLPAEKFIAGLVSFLLAHICYTIGFTNLPLPINLASLAIAVLISITSFQIYRRVSAGLVNSGRTEIRTPILIYTIVISVMLFSAMLNLVRPSWQTWPALTVVCGALLFYISDVFLAWSKFVFPLKFARLRVIIPYHLGQSLIILGIVLQNPGI